MGEKPSRTFPQSSARLWPNECLAHGQHCQGIHICPTLMSLMAFEQFCSLYHVSCRIHLAYIGNLYKSTKNYSSNLLSVTISYLFPSLSSIVAIVVVVGVVVLCGI